MDLKTQIRRFSNELLKEVKSRSSVFSMPNKNSKDVSNLKSLKKLTDLLFDLNEKVNEVSGELSRHKKEIDLRVLDKRVKKLETGIRELEKAIKRLDERTRERKR